VTADLTGPRARPTRGELRGLRLAVGLLGLAAVAVGTVLLFDPVAAADTLGLLLGLALLVGGLLEVAFAYDGPHRMRSMVLGTVLVVGGLVAAAWPDKTLTTLAFLVGICLIVHGALRAALAVAERHDVPGWGWLAAAGVLNVVVGVLVMAWPDVTIRVLSVVLGVQAVLFGVLLLLAAFLTGRGPRPVSRTA
jgi:uncharacterized membrane protein HdeD (DUF308 family)